MRKRSAALNVIVSAAGTVDLRLPVFALPARYPP